MTRVGVTSDRFETVASRYAAVGLEPVSLPCIRIDTASPDAIASAREKAARAQLLIITSPRVVSLLWPDGDMPEVNTAVVGSTTASCVTRAGGRLALVGDSGMARLVELMESRVHGQKVMIAHAEGSDPAAMARLREIVPDLDEHPVYRAVPIPPNADKVEAVAFASPSAVTGWAISRNFDDVVVGAIGATTAATVARHREPDVVAEQRSHLALAGAIASLMEVKV